MFSMNLDKAEGVYGFVDVKDKTWSGLIELISKDEKSNQQIATLMNGFKGMAAIFGPETMELVNKITIKGTSDGVRLEGSISEDLVEKVQAKIKEKQKP